MSLTALENKLSLVSEILTFSSNSLKKDIKEIYYSFIPDNSTFNFVSLDERIHNHITKEIAKFKPYASEIETLYVADSLIENLCHKHIVVLNTFLDISKGKMGLSEKLSLSKPILLMSGLLVATSVKVIVEILTHKKETLLDYIVAYIAASIPALMASFFARLPWDQREWLEKEKANQLKETARLLDFKNIVVIRGPNSVRYQGTDLDFALISKKRSESTVEFLSDILISNYRSAKEILSNYESLEEKKAVNSRD